MNIPGQLGPVLLLLAGGTAFRRGEGLPVIPQVTRGSGMCQMAAECLPPLVDSPQHMPARSGAHSGRLTGVIWQPLAHILQQGPWQQGALPNTTVAEGPT